MTVEFNSYSKVDPSKYLSNGCASIKKSDSEYNAATSVILNETVDNDEPISIPSGVAAIDSNFFPFFQGIPRGGITEIVGLPGSGKTSFAIQSCIQALALDPAYAVIYLDSSSNFDIERFNQIYRAQPWAHRVPISDFMARIFPIPFSDVYELLTNLLLLPKIISDLNTLDNFKVVMIVVDNVATPMRLFTKAIDTRINVINKLARDLRKIAAKFNCSILTINQMTTKRFIIQPARLEEDKEEISEFRNVPSLGNTWNSHLDTCICLRAQNNSIRFAELLKSVYTFVPLVDEATVNAGRKPICLELGEFGLREENL